MGEVSITSVGGELVEGQLEEAARIKEVFNSFASQMQNWGFQFPGGLPQGSQISQPGSVFHNLRWWLVSNLRQMLSEAYAEIGLVQNVVNVPVDDGLRGGINISTKQLSEDELARLKAYMDERNDIENAGMAMKWTRLFGGGALLVLSDQDPIEPLRVNDIHEGEDVSFRPVDMWELFYSQLNVSDSFDDSRHLEEYDYFDYYGESIHKSRVLIMKGIEAPSLIRPRLRGWGLSVVESLISSINQYLKAAGLTYEVLDEFKVDVYKIKNLKSAQAMMGGLDNLKKGVDLTNWMKNFQNAVVLDSEDDWDHKQLSFAGLADAQAGIRSQVASDMRIPQTKLFGQSSAGFNSGEDDIEVYNAMVESTVRTQLKRPILQVVKIRCMELFGIIPDDLTFTYQPLRVLSSVDQENVKTQKFQRALQARQAGLISAKNFAETANRAELFDVKIEAQDEDAGLNIVDVDEDDEEEESTQLKTKGSKVRDRESDLDYDEDEQDEDDDTSVKKSSNLRTRKTGRRKGVVQDDYERRMKQEERNRNKYTSALNSKKKQLMVLPRPYTKAQRLRRTVGNSVRFDLAEYQAAGGDDWIQAGRRPFFENPLGVDQALWTRARIESQKALGEIRWQYVAFMYKKLGGKFNGTNNAIGAN